MIWEIDDEVRAIEGVDAQGRPDPAYAAALGLVRAPLGRRAGAALIDLAIWLVLQLPFWLAAAPLLLKLAAGTISLYGLVNHPQFVLAVVMTGATLLLSLACLIVQLVLHGRRGVTIGKALTGIRSVNVLTLERPGVGRVLLRDLVLGAVSLVPMGLPLFLASPWFDPDGRRRAWHDKAGRLWLVDVRKGLNPYDEKRMRVARKMVRAEPVAERAPLPSLATPVDPVAQPAYRPGQRLSAGVIGAAKPYEDGSRPVVGLADQSPQSPVIGQEGRPVLGGYRTPTEEPALPAPVAPPAPPQTPAPPTPSRQPQPPFAQPTWNPAPAPAVEVVVGAAAADPAPVPERARLMLRFDTGEQVPVSEPLVVGRRPDPAEAPGARALPIPDESRSLSKTHLLVRPVADGLEVTDWRSTNGTAVVRGGVEQALPAGGSATVGEGDSILFGDRTAVVERV